MDAGQRYTEKSIMDLKARFADVYAQAEREMADKLEDYVTRHEARVEKQKAKLEAGKITKADYDAWMRGQIFQQKQWEAKAKSISDTLVHSDEIVQRMINGKQVDVFAANANWMSYQMEHGAGINFGFGLYDNATVTRLIRDNPDLLPPKLVQYKADSTWYQKKITNCVTQGIIQGEGLEEITQRIMRDTKESSESHAIRNARTAMTSAQNAGRVESMLDAEKLGIDVKKQWVATLDTKTRDAHQKLDGQEVEPDEFFEVDGQYIRYPGDPHAEPELVQNCRCKVISTYPKYPSKFKRRDNIDGQVIKDMTYTEWFKAKFAEQANEPEAEQRYKQIAISDLEKMRSSELESEIEEPINNKNDYSGAEYDNARRTYGKTTGMNYGVAQGDVVPLYEEGREKVGGEWRDFYRETGQAEVPKNSDTSNVLVYPLPSGSKTFLASDASQNTILSDGRIAINKYTAQEDTRAKVKEMVQNEIDILGGVREDGVFYRVTGNAKEAQYIKNGTIKPSVNHLKNEKEDGLSVWETPKYFDKYLEKVRGEVIGIGSDGEPLLDVKGLTLLEDNVNKADIAEMREKGKTLFKELYGWSDEQLDSALTGKYKIRR